ncbi:MAG: hypothetical protein H0W72_10075 [Planctomycetes bacterium]|nr:hypothetical protein [Planctomycetota bacterium]
MSLPLQPDLRPWPVWLSRLIAVLALAIALVVLGLIAGARRAPPRLLLSGPGNEFVYARAVERLIAGARSRVWVAMFVVRAEDEAAVRPMLQALADARGRGVDVRVCLDLGDRVGMAGEPDAKHEVAAAWLRGLGVPVVIDERERTTHSKVVVVDDRYAIVGSHNWTYSALGRNREASLLVDDPAIVAELERGLFATIDGWESPAGGR